MPGLILVAGVVGFFVLLLFNRWKRQREAELEARMMAAATGARAAPSRPAAPEPPPAPDADLRRPGPYVFPDAPPEIGTRPQGHDTRQPDGYDPDGPALVQAGPMRYRGSGIEPKRHPLSDHPSFGHFLRDSVCGHCGSHRVLVIDLSWSVHPYSGDAYWDYVTRCTECAHFNQYAGWDGD